jgi:ATP-dependent helicase YprA (DUF1998 family)
VFYQVDDKLCQHDPKKVDYKAKAAKLEAEIAELELELGLDILSLCYVIAYCFLGQM